MRLIQKFVVYHSYIDIGDNYMRIIRFCLVQRSPDGGGLHDGDLGASDRRLLYGQRRFGSRRRFYHFAGNISNVWRIGRPLVRQRVDQRRRAG